MQNKLNLEIKYFCTDFSPIRKVLKDIGAKRVGTFVQKDYFFNLPATKSKVAARLKLRIQNNKQILIYYKRDDFKIGQNNPADVTIFNVMDKNLLDFLIKTLGVKSQVIKRRELWEKDNFVFNLDNVFKVGKVFEMEMTTAKKMSQKDEALFDHFKKQVLPFLGPIVKGSNLDLVLKTLK